MTDLAPTPVANNPFSLLAFVLFKTRQSLEESDGSRPPRWVRIARGRQFSGQALSDLVRGAVVGVGQATSYMADLTIRIEELLVQTDAAKAIAEVTLDFIGAAGDPQFIAAVNTLVGGGSGTDVAGALSGLQTAANNLRQYLGYIPEPEAVRQLGHELYRLLCVVQRDFPRQASGSIDVAHTSLAGIDHVDLADTGKLRLCAWAYARSVPARGLGLGRATLDVGVFGTRRLFTGGALPINSDGRWVGSEGVVTTFHFDYDGPIYVDLQELVALLGAHGYTDAAVPVSPTSMTPALVNQILRFQFLNELPLSGEVDNHTINRLMNLDFARKNLRRAVPYDASTVWPWIDPIPLGRELPIINAGADRFADEGITPVSRATYSYYEVRTTGQIGNIGSLPQGRGWVADPVGTLAFVAIQSRFRNVQPGVPGRYDGGILSEGEAAYGRYFWGARMVEPWKGGRSGVPEPGALFGASGPPPPPPPASSSVSRMYQWIPLPPSMFTIPFEVVPAGQTARLYVVASVLQRSLYRNRSTNGSPDRGRIILEAYDSSVYTGTSNALQAREAADPRVGFPQATEWFPDPATTALALTLEEVDQKRVWFLRKTDPLELTGIPNVTALCLVAEGQHQAGYDTDAYFDDFRVEYYWRLVPNT